jgi:hypothetical protein
MSQAPFPVNPELTAVAVKYRNTRFIADMVSPRLPVGVQSFKYWTHKMEEAFNIRDTRVGRRSKPNEVEFTATETTASTVDYGLDDPIPQNDIDNAPAGHDPVLRAVEGVTDLIMLDRERRVASLLFASGTYASGNQTTLSGTSQWSDYVNSDPIGAIAGAIDTPVMRPNVGVIGRAAYTKLRGHPKIVKAVLGNAGDAGLVSAAAIAALFELDDLLVGEGFFNSAKRGQTASMSRVWGKHMALIYRDPNMDPAGNRASFCWTAQWRDRIAGALPDSNISMRGGQRVRVGESVKEIVSAPDLGFFLQNVVA